jgi:hypothetical protein
VSVIRAPGAMRTPQFAHSVEIEAEHIGIPIEDLLAKAAERRAQTTENWAR